MNSEVRRFRRTHQTSFAGLNRLPRHFGRRTLSAGAPGRQRERVRAGWGVRLARDHSGAPGTPRVRPGCRSQAPPSAGLRGSPPAPWRAITGQGSTPQGLGGGAAPALGESNGWRIPTGSPRAKQGLLLTPLKSVFHK